MARVDAATTLKLPSVTASCEAAAHGAMLDRALQDVAAGRLRAEAIFVRQQHHRVDKLAGRQRQHRLGVALDIVVPVEQRQEANRRHDHQEDDDQCRDRTLEQRLGGEQATIGRLGDDARIAARTSIPAGPAPDRNRPLRARATRPYWPLKGSPSPLFSLTIRQRRTPESSIRNQR